MPRVVKLIELVFDGVICIAWGTAFVAIVLYAIQCFVDQLWLVLAGVMIVVIVMIMLTAIVAKQVAKQVGWV